MQIRPIVIELELHPTADNLTGLITGPDGQAGEFSGWIGLVAALDALVRAHCASCGLSDDSDQTPKGARP